MGIVQCEKYCTPPQLTVCATYLGCATDHPAAIGARLLVGYQLCSCRETLCMVRLKVLAERHYPDTISHLLLVLLEYSNRTLESELYTLPNVGC